MKHIVYKGKTIRLEDGSKFVQQNGFELVRFRGVYGLACRDRIIFESGDIFYFYQPHLYYLMSDNSNSEQPVFISKTGMPNSRFCASIILPESLNLEKEETMIVPGELIIPYRLFYGGEDFDLLWMNLPDKGSDTDT